MIAPWLFELLRREADWRAALPRIASQISELPEDRVRAALDLGAAFEHVEPDRRRAIGAYQLAGPRRDGGRSRALAMQLGWWAAVARLAQIELQATSAVEPLIAACRALIDSGDPDHARRLLADARVTDTKGDERLATLRAELAGRADEWTRWVHYARTLSGLAAAEAFVSAARLARAAGRDEWPRHLEAALAADPGHRLASAMLTDHAFATGDRKAILDVMRIRLANTDEPTYCDVLREIAARVTLTTPNHGGLARRLLRGALDRAYEIGLSQIRGHLAMWALLDQTAAQDGRRTELLPLLIRALDLALPDYDRVWLAALGAEICGEAGDAAAARSYAAVIAEHAPSHPTVLALLVETRATTADPQLLHDLDLMQLDAATVRPVAEVAPHDDGELVPADDFELAPMSASLPPPAQVHAHAPIDPRYVDLSVPVLEDPEEVAPARVAARPAPASEPRPVPAPEPRPVVAAAPAPASAPATPALAPAPPAPASAAASDAPTRVVRGPIAPAAAPSAPAATAAAASALDDEWQVDEDLFVPRKRTTAPPASVPASAPESSPRPPPVTPATVAPAVPATVAPAVPATVAPAVPAKPASSDAPTKIIPAAALQVLKAGGSPRPLPKIPTPSRAVPRADRTALPVDIRLSREGRALAAHTRDLSTTGFFVVTAAAFEIGVELDCEVSIPGADGLSERTFSTRARIVRRDLSGYGAVFVDPPAALTTAIGALRG